MQSILRSCVALCVVVTISSQRANAAEDKSGNPLNSGSSPTDALKTVQTGVDSVNGFVGAMGASTEQMNAMYKQMQNLYKQNTALSGAQGEFAALQEKMGAALGRAKQCNDKAAEAVKNIKTKFKKATIPPGAVATVEASCSNYGNVIDSIRATLDNLDTANAKIACSKTLESEMNQLAEASKKPFNNLTAAATEKVGVYDSIVKIHKNISDKITNDLDGKNGKGGYRQKLADLKKLSIDLNNAIGGSDKGGKSESGLPTGLERKADKLKRDRVNGANRWQNLIMEDVKACFFSDSSRPCDANGSDTPFNCLSRHLTPPTKTQGGPQEARNEFNRNRLNQIFSTSYGRMVDLDTKENLDIKDPYNFLKFSKTRFQRIEQEFVNNFAGGSFKGVGDGKQSELASFIQSKFDECYTSASNRFVKGMESEGNPYKDIQNQIIDSENDLKNDSKNWVENTQRIMNEFKTAFSKTYNNELPQFAANCSSTEDPYATIDCLKVLNVTLKTGIDGTNQTVKLGNGTSYTATEGTQNLQVSNLSMGQDGKPVMSQTQVECRGFNECLTFLEQSRSAHDGEQQTQEQAKEGFVAESNKNTKSMMDAMATQFGAMSTNISTQINEVNQGLTTFGVGATLHMKPVEGEAMKVNEKTKLYDVPTSMKKAIAASGSISEIDGFTEVKAAVDKKKADLQKKHVEAMKMKQKCTIDKGAYEALVGAFPKDCDGKQVCRYGGTRAMTALERIIRKSQSGTPKDSESDEAAKTYRQCKSEAESKQKRDRADLLDSKEDPKEITVETSPGRKETTRPKKELNSTEKQESKDQLESDLAQCRRDIFESLQGLNQAARGSEDASYKANNQKILSAVSDVEEACGKQPQDLVAATAACKAYQKVAKSAPVMENEGETPQKSEGNSEDSGTKNPLTEKAN